MEARTPTHLPQVTERQLEVARLVADGLDNPSIARELGISLAGAKYHVSELLSRLDLSSRQEIGDWYREHRTSDSALRRHGFAPIAWAAGGLGGAVAAVIAVVAIAVGSGGGDAGVTPAVTAVLQPSPQAILGGGFLPVAAPPTSQRLRFSATLLNDGRVLIAGGRTTDSSDDKIAAEIYDPALGTFETTGETVEPRYSHATVRLSDGRVLLTGGLIFDPDTLTAAVLTSTEVYDPSSGTFYLGASMTEPRWDHAASTLRDGRVLISGGVIADGEDGSPTVTMTAEIYDPEVDQFTPTGSMSIARRSHQLTLLEDGRVLASGGGPLELYDPQTGEFSPFGGEPTFGNEARVVTPLLDGRMLITGAYDDAEARAQGRTEQANVAFIVDPTSGLAERTADMLTGRSSYHTATLLPDGRVLVAGGAGGFGTEPVYPPAEIFNPTTAEFEAIAFIEDDTLPGGVRATNVATHIAGHRAVPLADGSVLLVGLRPGSLETVIERFDPGAAAGDDRYAEILARMAAIPRFEPGAVLNADSTTLFVGPGEPFALGALVAAAAERGLQIRGLPVGSGVCSAGARGGSGQGLRAERLDGSSGIEDFTLYVYPSIAAASEHWVIDDAGQVTTRPGSECDASFAGRFSRMNVTAYINGNQLLLLGFPPYPDFSETDDAVRALLVEAFGSMPD